MNVQKVLTNKNLTNLDTGMAKTVFVTTGLKAIGRPAFIYADKKSDKETKKYTAGKEFLYQVLCLGIALAMLPVFKKGGAALAKNSLKKAAYSNATDEIKKAVVTGGEQLGDLVGSILGLTLIAPIISHKVLHPVMKFLGMEKKPSNIGQPVEPSIAETKAAGEKATKLNIAT